MKNKKIIIAGGSGFIGEEMIRYFGKENTIVILTRQLPNSSNNRNQYTSLTSNELSNTTFVQWDGKTIGPWQKELEAENHTPETEEYGISSFVFRNNIY